MIPFYVKGLEKINNMSKKDVSAQVFLTLKKFCYVVKGSSLGHFTYFYIGYTMKII